MERRDVIKGIAAGLAGAAIAPAAGAATEQASGASSGVVTGRLPRHPDMKYRPLGTTGEHVSLIGCGGYHLAKPSADLSNEAAIRIVHGAIEGGVTFFDNCWDYNGGESEVRLGRALAGGWRDRVFLMTKLDGRTAAAARGQLETSLSRLGTDHIDLIQFHEVIRMDDPERIFAPGGALEAMLRAREEGKIRYIGFTGHKSPMIHKHMFEVADAHGFHFDTVQMPLNIMDAHYDSFQQIVLPMAIERGTGVLGMKAFGDTFIVQSKVVPPIDMLQYPMNLPISVQVTGIDGMPILRQALDAVRDFTPWSQGKLAAVLGRSAAIALTGETERYKTSHHFDGTVHNPQWLTEA